MVTYRSAGRVHHVLAWGAVDARQPTRGRPQVAFRKDYSGRRWASFSGQCRPYDGPAIAYLVTACAAPDGSYWALQAWRRTLPNFDGKPTARLGALELRLSHWSGPIAVLEAWTDWVYGGRFHHLFGRLTYDGQPVHGFSATTVGNPTDTYGRNIYVDTLDSRYGKGWHRENAFLAHNPNGVFCYGFYKFTPRGPGNGAQYRLSTIGPGSRRTSASARRACTTSTRRARVTSRTSESRTRCRTRSWPATRSARFTERVGRAGAAHTRARSARPRAGSTRTPARAPRAGAPPTARDLHPRRADHGSARSGTAPATRGR